MFQAPKLTNVGKELYYRNMAGEQIVFTTIQMGSGALTGAIANMTALVTPMVTIDAALKKYTDYVDVSGTFSNAGLTEGFFWREIGVFAANPDDPENRDADILYCYQNAYDTADFIPAASVETVEKNITVPIIVGDATEVSCILSDSLILATKKNLADHDADPDAHGGLREQIEGNTEAIRQMGQEMAAALEEHDEDPEAHGGLRAQVEENTEGVKAAKAAASKAQETADEALDAITKLTHTIDATPSQNGTLSYTGSAQSPSWNSYNPETLIIGGVVSGTNAGTYTATFTPVEGYVWSDGTDTARSVTWTIGRAAITTIPSQSGTLTYTGSAQSPTWSNYDTSKMTIGGTTSGTAAGSYSATFTPSANYQWSDGTTAAKTVAWTIGRVTITTTPSQSGTLTYTGSVLTPSWSNYDTEKMTIGGTTSATTAGSYSATFTPTTNYQWSDGTTAAKTVAWTIAKAAGSLTINTTSLSLVTGSLTGTITVTRTGDGAITASSSSTSVATVAVSGNTVTVTGKATGTATITVNVAAGTNHTAPTSKTCSVDVKIFDTTLENNTWALIKSASDSGIAANLWSVGDTKSITISGTVGNTTFSSLSINAFILGFNHNSSREGANRIHFQIGKIGAVDVALIDSAYNTNQTTAGYFNMNITNVNTGGWSSSRMRSTLLGSSYAPTSPLASSLLAALPSDLRAVMKSCTKYSDNTGGGSDTASYVTATTDYLFLLSEFEYHGARTYANSAEQNYQAQYDYYKAGNSKIKYRHSATTSTALVWCRSVYATASANFCLVHTNGSANLNNAYASYGVAPGFCA